MKMGILSTFGLETSNIVHIWPQIETICYLILLCLMVPETISSSVYTTIYTAIPGQGESHSTGAGEALAWSTDVLEPNNPVLAI